MRIGRAHSSGVEGQIRSTRATNTTRPVVAGTTLIGKGGTTVNAVAAYWNFQ